MLLQPFLQEAIPPGHWQNEILNADWPELAVLPWVWSFQDCPSCKLVKDIFNSNYNITCENGLVRIDYKSLFPSQMMQQYSEMDIEMDITGTDIELPNDLSVGQELADANVSIAMSMSGIKMNTTVDQTNRKVEKKESITVAAGTFDCYLVTETNISKTMGAKIEMNTKQWLAEGVGMVKQESYKRNGNLMSRTELTKFSK